ncbi:CRISPR-associated protein Cas02710 [Kyrpidia tusciae]|uniref:CRISPR-associated protein Cas02710 n=1 Tax=Kyrpidia tusciae (strain DSM 2912 / NBRC 15312 / T2) TaxID=562970 RepID=D5WRW9_KYRT2|nr:CRISPR-associated protein Cas02710 [Kyrpidia tusciae]ADG06921.1 CRISPR-associated protein Cas02710 [Kyrpidia tusciae DSM 2912]
MDEESLRSDTRRYWELQRHNDSTDWVLEQYISDKRQKLGGNSLLEAEMEQIRQRSSPEHCETLVLLVGLSLEPLLQSICLYQPAGILLVLSDDEYAGEPRHAYVGHVFEAIERLRDEGLIDRVPKYLGKNPAGEGQFVETADDPLAVFRTLVETLRDEPCPVIDITGGKKSMVAGAFLYAAYAGVRISYVDFTEYDRNSRRPYGYLSKIGELPNPYEKFALREWERVRLLYQRYQFREARRLLEDIWKAMSALMADSANALDSLDRYLEYYEKWDQGDYRGAEEIQRDLGNFRQPNAVVELGGRWYRIEGDDYVEPPKYLYGDQEVLKVYAYDELKRIQRLIDYTQDYRSAFLRAGALNEIIMLARLVDLIKDDNDRKRFLEPLDNKTPSAESVFKALTNPDKEIHVGSNRKKHDISFKNAPEMTLPKPPEMKPWWNKTVMFRDDPSKGEKGWDKFLNRRNDLMHKYFPVSRQWAEDALRFVEANFEDFLGLRTKDMPLYAEAVPWPELCELCGLQRFLPSSLVRDEAGKGGSE